VLDHHYIDDHSIAERYLRHALPPHERCDFEEHLVDCQECADRLLLAEMFLSRNGAAGGSAALENPAPLYQLPVEPLPLRARIAARLTPWQLFILFVITALILLSMPAAGVLLQQRLHR
jgi:hypothetical protein